MPRRTTSSVAPFISRIPIPYKNLNVVDGNVWRNIVRSQPIFPICRDTIIQRLLAMDWQVTITKTDERERYIDDRNYYTELIRKADNENFGFFLDKIMQDALDTPFGGIAEIVPFEKYKNADGTPRIYGIFHADGATFYPTYNSDYPVAQLVPGDVKPVYLEKGHYARILYNPRPEIMRAGYGMPPPEKVYLALELLVRGDRYYAQLLSDTPEAGLLDLMDMDEETATRWLESFRSLLAGIDPLKIPVLYEHEQPAHFIPFGRPPVDLMLDTTTQKYIGISAAGYGITISDIGVFLGSGGSLAASIRNERQTRRTGIGTAVSKVETFFNSILPKYLKFKFLIQDEEEIVARGRARATNFMAFSSAIQAGILDATEARRQIKADNLLDIEIPDEPPAPPAEQPLPGFDQSATPGAVPTSQNAAANTVEPDVIGTEEDMDTVDPNQGGMGNYTAIKSEISNTTTLEFKNLLVSKLSAVVPPLTDVKGLCDKQLKVLAKLKSISPEDSDEFSIWKSAVDELASGFGPLVGTVSDVPSANEVTRTILETLSWWKIKPDEYYYTMASEAISSGIDQISAELSSEGQMLPEINLNTIVDKSIDRINDHIKDCIIKASWKAADSLVWNSEPASEYALWEKFKNSIFSELRKNLGDLAKSEILGFEQHGRLTALLVSGVETKKWIYRGEITPESPCPVCTAHISKGPVPLDYEYAPDILYPPGCLKDDCIIVSGD